MSKKEKVQEEEIENVEEQQAEDSKEEPQAAEYVKNHNNFPLL